MKWKNKISWKRLIPFLLIVLFGLILLSCENIQHSFLLYLYNLLNLAFIQWIFLFIAVVIGSMYYLAVLSKISETKILFHAFGPFLDSILTGLSYGILIQTSFTFLRGLFNQMFFNKLYFIGFSYWDLSIMGVLMAFLFYWSAMKLYKMATDIFVIRNLGAIEPTHASSETENKVMQNDQEKTRD